MIKQFRGPYSFLSNFYLCQVNYEGITYPSSEHAFQAAKTNDLTDKIAISKLATPGESKHWGRRVSLRDDWNMVRLQVMENILCCKFEQNPELKISLINTGDEELLEGNTWNDTFWGINLKDGQGENNLGKILMKLRKEYQEEGKN